MRWQSAYKRSAASRWRSPTTSWRKTRIARAPRGRERVVDQRRRLVDAHEIVLEEARREAAGRGDDGSNDLIISQVVRTNELQSWFVYEHLHAHDAPR